MTRPRVDPDKRQRTAQACDSCKRRKQKCNGAKPCNTCSKRSTLCTYEHGSDDMPSPKRRMTDSVGDSIASSTAGPSPPLFQSTQASEQMPQWPPVVGGSSQVPKRTQEGDISSMETSHGLNGVSPTTQQNIKKETPNSIDESSNILSHGSSSSGHDEEAVVYNYTRMLQDPTGRLLYIGDSATLSFLQLIRMIVDNVAGPSRFTMDPSRHRIVENNITLPPHIRQTHLLPDRQTCDVLVDAFFINTNGIIEVFHRKAFLNTLDMCYSDPLGVDPNWLCLLYLTLAIGLVMAVPTPGTKEDAIIQKLRAEPIDRGEVFYSNAKHLKDPSTGFEDAGFWSIQALTLMSVYMLVISKRNAAYAYYGMAVRTAFALGLHREETMCIFSGAEQIIRRNLWRTLYILDRFLSASLGRPTAIRESDCSGDTLTTGEKPPFPQAPFPTAANAGFAGALGLEASVRSCHVIGVILEKVYSKRKISTKLAQEIADHCKGWPKALDPSLHWRHGSSADPLQGMAILHVNLFYCHSIVLLTRPFFLFLMNKTHQERKDTGQRPQRLGTRLEKFAEACVIASCHSIVLVQNALEGRYLPHRNPFVVYFLFASALVVLSNEFTALFQNPTADSCISNAINIMHYCGQQDPQASRLLFILTSFRDVVVRQNLLTRQGQLPQTQQTQQNDSIEPMSDLFLGATVQERAAAMTVSAPSPLIDPNLTPQDRALAEQSIGRQNSLPSVTPSPLFSTSNARPSSSSNSKTSNNHHPDQQMNLNVPPIQKSRHNSLDTFFDLARVPSNSADGDSLGGVEEIDFEMLWQWPGTGSGMTPGGSGIGLTPAGSSGIFVGSSGSGGQGSMGGGGGGGIDIQGVSDSVVPLFGINNTEFGGS